MITRLQEVEKLLDNNLQLITDYTKRAAELIGSARQLEKERDKLTKKNRGLEVVRCKDCVKLNRHDCPMCYIENKTLQFAEVKPNFFCAAGRLTEEENAMNVNGRWYTETEAQAYIITLEHKNAALEDKHLSECRQISEYDRELRQAKQLLKAAVEDIVWLNEHTVDGEGQCLIETATDMETCLACPLNVNNSHLCCWKHLVEALALIGNDIDVPATEGDTNVGHKQED